MNNKKKFRKIGFSPGHNEPDNESDLTRKRNTYLDPRISAITNSFAYVENIDEADSFLLLSQVRAMCNAFPFKDKDPIRELLHELEDSGFVLRVNELDKMGYPVRRLTPFLKLSPNTAPDECD